HRPQGDGDRGAEGHGPSVREIREEPVGPGREQGRRAGWAARKDGGLPRRQGLLAERAEGGQAGRAIRRDLRIARRTHAEEAGRLAPGRGYLISAWSSLNSGVPAWRNHSKTAISVVILSTPCRDIRSKAACRSADLREETASSTT